MWTHMCTRVQLAAQLLLLSPLGSPFSAYFADNIPYFASSGISQETWEEKVFIDKGIVKRLCFCVGSWIEWIVGLVRGWELACGVTAAEGCSAPARPTGKASTHLLQVLKLLSPKTHSPAGAEGIHFPSWHFISRLVLAFHTVVMTQLCSMSCQWNTGNFCKTKQFPTMESPRA